MGAQAITGEALAHWTEVARRSDSHASDAELVAEALPFLISGEWVLGEARALGVSVSEAQVRHTFDRIRAQQFRKRGEFERFLRSSGETVADLLYRVRLNITSERIQTRVVPRHASAKARARALSKFVADFKAKWTARTACASAYAVANCGSVF